MRIELSKPAYLAAATLFVSRDASRLNIQAVRVERAAAGGVHIIATDGTCMVVFWDLDACADTDTVLIVPKELAQAAKYKNPRTEAASRLHITDELMTLTLDGDTRLFKTVAPDIVYPDWRRVIPRRGDLGGSPFGVHPGQIGDFGKMLKMAFGPGNPAIHIVANKDARGAAFVSGDSSSWFGVLMGVRGAAFTSPPFPLDPAGTAK